MFTFPSLQLAAELFLSVFAHSLWQGALVCLFLIAVLRLLPTRLAELRYTSAAVAFLAIPSLACITLWSLTYGRTEPVLMQVSLPVQKAGFEHPNQPIHSTNDERRPQILAPNDAGEPSSPSMLEWNAFVHGYVEAGRYWLSMPIACFWFAGVCLFLTRGFLSLRSATRFGTRTEIEDPRVQNMMSKLLEKFAINQSVKLVACEKAFSPYVTGILKPVIVVPGTILTGLTIDQWQMLLGHELAHIKRGDFLFNLIQLCVESVFFFNPAIWWVSAQVRLEREAVCDAWAVQGGICPIAYSELLMSLGESIMLKNTIGFRGTSPRTLLTRVDRLLSPNLPRGSYLGRSGLITLVMALAAASFFSARVAVTAFGSHESNQTQSSEATVENTTLPLGENASPSSQAKSASIRVKVAKDSAGTERVSSLRYSFKRTYSNGSRMPGGLLRRSQEVDVEQVWNVEVKDNLFQREMKGETAGPDECFLVMTRDAEVSNFEIGLLDEYLVRGETELRFGSSKSVKFKIENAQDTKLPPPKVTVVVIMRSQDTLMRVHQTTEDDGMLELKLSEEHWGDYEIQFINQQEHLRGQAIRLAAGVTEYVVQIENQPLLEGQFLDATNTPIPNAQVFVEELHRNDRPWGEFGYRHKPVHDVADELGMFRVGGLPAGEILLYADDTAGKRYFVKPSVVEKYLADRKNDPSRKLIITSEMLIDENNPTAL